MYIESTQKSAQEQNKTKQSKTKQRETIYMYINVLSKKRIQAAWFGIGRRKRDEERRYNSKKQISEAKRSMRTHTQNENRTDPT